MNYQITIERKEPNPNFETELADWKERTRFNNSYVGSKANSDYPNAVNITNALICELTEEQYKAIKAEVFKTFK